MKMKRMFSKKKKAANRNNVIYDQKSMDPVDESGIIQDPPKSQTNPKSNGRKKQRQRKKKKDQAKTNSSIEYQVTKQTGINPERDSGFLEDRIVPGNRGNEEKRILGSESSSRTASSASSSSTSSRPWSGRPWSLIESQRGQSLSDLTKTDSSDISFDMNRSGDGHNLTASTICTLPRGACLEEEKFSKSMHSRTFTLDFNFFRRFKRSSASTSSSNHKRLSTSQLYLSQVSDERRTFSIRNFRKGRKSKKCRDDFVHDASSRNNDSFPLPTTTTNKLDRQARILNSVQENELEGVLCSKAPSSETSSSKASVNTVVSVSDAQTTANASVRSPVNKDISYSSNMENRQSFTGFPSENKESIVKCTCQNDRTASRRSVCCCCMLSSNFHAESSVQSPLDSSRTSFPPAKTGISNSLTNFSNSMSLAFDGMKSHGGSMKNIYYGNHFPPVNRSSEYPPRQSASNFCVLSPKESLVYASTPHVNFSNVDVVDSEEKRPKASSVKQNPSSGKRKSQPTLAALSIFNLQSKSNDDNEATRNQTIYPGVVLRRHQNRVQGKSIRSPLHSSSSSSLSRHDREMQVMSLNVEDLPTYEMMRNGPRWRRSATAAKERGHSLAKASCDELSRENLFKQHSTSIDDLRELNFLPDNFTIDQLKEMDDDEYLNFTLAFLAAKDAIRREQSKMGQQEITSKRVKNLKKSLANLISPGKQGRKPQRSSSFKDSSGSDKKINRPSGVNNSSGGGTGVLAAYRPPGKRGKSSNAKNRHSKLWSETFDHSGLEEEELKRQEAIYELYQGECVMVEDLKMANKTYRDSMVTLKMLTDDEVTRIFGKLDCLLPLHEDLLSRFEATRTESGRTESVGDVFIDWFPSLSPYDEYCANLADAKETLDSVVNRERVRDFLQRCLESPFSRKLDLWSYLDLPRSRLVKYPLLLKAIRKATPTSHPDFSRLEEAIDIINDIIARVDNLTGERQAKFVKSKLEYLDEKKKCPEVELSRKIICSGQLKNNRGTKIHVFLFDLALVLTRTATRGDHFAYQVHRQPVALKSLIVETEEGGKLSGSFRGSLLSSDKAKHSFRVKSESANVAYTLIATDEHHKKQWVNSIQEAINNCRSGLDEAHFPPTPESDQAASGQLSVKITAVDRTEKISVRRTSSIKSDSGSVHYPWYRNRTFTVGNPSGRRSSREKIDDNDVSKSKLSPLFRRRHSKSSLLGLFSGTNVLERKYSLDEKNDCNRSRSLSSSPIAFLTNLSRMKLRTGSGLTRSESCYSKPPSGRLGSLTQSFRGNRSFPKFPSMAITRSIPDLTAYQRNRSNSDHSLTLEAVPNRLALGDGGSTTTLSESLAEEATKVESPPEQIETNTSSPSSSQFVMGSPSRPLSRTSSQSTIPDLDYNVCVTSTPVHNDERNTTKNPFEGSLEQANSMSSTRSLSSASFINDPSPMDDVEDILEKASSETIRGDCETTPTNQPINDRDEIATTLDEVLNLVCDSISHCAVSDQRRVSLSRNSNFVILTADNEQPWEGNDIEMMV